MLDRTLKSKISNSKLFRKMAGANLAHDIKDEMM